MTKFLFKSNSQSDFSKNISNKLDMILTEQRHQRSDLSILLNQMSKIYNALALQKQVDEFFDDESEPGIDPLPDSKDSKQDGNS